MASFRHRQFSHAQEKRLQHLSVPPNQESLTVISFPNFFKPQILRECVTR